MTSDGLGQKRKQYTPLEKVNGPSDQCEFWGTDKGPCWGQVEGYLRPASDPNKLLWSYRCQGHSPPEYLERQSD